MIKPIKIQKLNSDTKTWEPITSSVIHANVNKSSNGSAYLSSGSEQSKANKVFSIRWRKDLSEIQFNKQFYRIIFDGVIYEILDYDDYQEKHITIKLSGVSRGVEC